MAIRFFSDFPDRSTVLEKSGLLAKAWSLWFRDLFNQVNDNAEKIQELEDTIQALKDDNGLL